jgi:molybdenum cofactor guanylyltransferase
VTVGAESGLPRYDAVVLAGGAARRLGGVDKPTLDVGGLSLLDRVTAAVAGATQVVLVGPDRPGLSVTVTTSEEPPGSGPLAALAAGVRYVAAPTVVVLAADLPYVEPPDIDRLRTELARHPTRDAAIAVDAGGHQHHLLACWRTSALGRHLVDIGSLRGTALRHLTARASIVHVRLSPREGRAPEFDIDTPADLAAARGLASVEDPDARDPDGALARDERRT